MEEENKSEKKNFLNGTSEISKNIKVLRLNNKQIKSIGDSLKLPLCLNELYLIDNQLKEIPLPVMNLRNLKILDISFNEIQFFDVTPNFCHSIERLNISNNRLLAPPYWVWAESPRNLEAIDLSFNENIKNGLQNEYLEELLKYTSLLTDVKMNNCRLSFKHEYSVLATLANVKYLQLGTKDINLYSTKNHFEEIPCTGLDKCCHIQKLDLTNTSIFNINGNITIFKNLHEINLSQNKLNSIPIEFCSLSNLEVCILSMNYILYLPDEFVQLTKLEELSLDSNELCMLPDNICDLPHLKKLDLYDNKLYDIPKNIENITEIDLAQNYFEEPEDEEYMSKRYLARKGIVGRLNACRIEIARTDSVDLYDNDELSSSMSDNNEGTQNRSLSSPEDWDADEYWIPHHNPHRVLPNRQWINFVKTKMAEGNFCPIDAHEASIVEKVKLEKINNPQVQYESDGQFDDCSDDDS